MKLTAIIDDGLQSEAFYENMVKKALHETHADAVAAIMAGPIIQSGVLPREDVPSRASKLRRAGCALVVEVPVHGTLLKHDTYYYVLAMLLQKMNCVDFLYLPCRVGDADMLSRCTRFLLHAPVTYQKTLARLRDGRNLHEVVPEAVEQFVPGGQAVLAAPMNRFAAEMHNALILSYSPTKAVICEADWAVSESTMPESADERLGDLIARSVCAMDMPAISDIFGSTDAIAERIKKARGSFSAMSERLGVDSHEARQLLLRTYLNYRFISHSNAALYSYVPAIRLLAGEDKWSEALKAKASAPVAAPGEEMTDLELSAKKLYCAVYA